MRHHAWPICPALDALALGRTAEELRKLEPDVPDAVLPHRVFEGNRPSVSLLFPQLTAYALGQLLALYEVRGGVGVVRSLVGQT